MFGIDFGTTNSANVMFYNKKYENFGDKFGNPIPSAIAINKNTGEVYRGREAWSQKQRLKENCEYIHSVKMLLGKNWKKDIAGRTWTAVDIASEVFKGLKSEVARIGALKANAIYDEKDAVVAIPIGFSPQKRNELRQAAKNAGITIKQFISEPTAAFYANYADLKSATNIAVFDWGGGTLDISIIEHRNGKIYEKATDGIDIAGDVIDETIARRLHNIFASKNPVQFESIPSDHREQLIRKVQEAKCKLSDANAMPPTITLNMYGNYGPQRYTLSYGEFSSYIESIVNKALECLDNTIKAAGMTINDIDKLLMVGGSSNLGPLNMALVNKYGNNIVDKIFKPQQPEWNIAEGAALLSVKNGQYYSNQNIGVLMNDGGVYNLLNIGQPLNGTISVVNFAATDCSGKAQFVFTGSPDINTLQDRYKIFEISKSEYAFLNEQVIVESYVDENLIFYVDIHSDLNKKGKKTRWWEYSALKYYFQI